MRIAGRILFGAALAMMADNIEHVITLRIIQGGGDQAADLRPTAAQGWP
jgi:hypothetical protein